MDIVFWVHIVLGILMLLVGRRFFWVFVGSLGFIAGFACGREIFGLESLQTLLIAASVFGITGIVIALFMQGVALGIAGFLAGSYVTFSLLPVLGEFPPEITWLSVLVGGVVGIVLSILLIDWMLIFLSSVAGAAIISQYVLSESYTKPVVWIVLAVAGIIIQTTLFLRNAKKR